MKICFWCDLHLPAFEDAIQYDVLFWALNDVKKKNADCVVFAGDITCDGNINVYKEFLSQFENLPMRTVFIPGNSDLRDASGKNEIHMMSSPCKNSVCDINIYAINDSDLTISDDDFNILEDADETSVVFMHHPPSSLMGDSKLKFFEWRKSHPETKVFFGHCHKSFEDGNDISLQAMDPDKSIGESPCITYYDTDSEKLSKTYYFCPPPTDIYKYFGISCYSALKDIEFAIKNRLSSIELRPGFLKENTDKLKSLIAKWRSICGENLSLHLPDISYENGKVVADDKFHDYLKFGEILNVDRFTQHVPKVSVAQIKNDENALLKIASFLAQEFNSFEKDIVIGVENMHMTSKEKPDTSRRFGYIPEECLEFMNILSKKCRHKVGINFDIGHARNNAPFSQKYQIGTWLSMLGKHIVGYHIHQVLLDEDGFHNHCAIDGVYARLIGYASFFKYWSKCRINKVPIIFEMRADNAYDITLKTFDECKKRIVSDLHSHTFYSACGMDSPEKLVTTAIENGISVLGITDHDYGIGKRKKEYITKVRDVAEKYKDRIKILCGIEIATVEHEGFDTIGKIINEFDYCLLENVDNPDSLIYSNLFEYVKSLGIPCGIAHTDLFALCDKNGEDYETFFRKMAECEMFWEINVNYDSIHGYKNHVYVEDLINDIHKIEILKKTGVYLSIGFDSHSCEEYDGIRVYDMYDFLKSNGINIKTGLHQ